MTELANLIVEVSRCYSLEEIIPILRRDYFPHLSEELREIDEELIRIIQGAQRREKNQ